MNEENKELEVIQNNKKGSIKMALKEIAGKLITSAVLGLISACGKLAEKASVRKNGETKWYMIVLWTVLAVVLGALATFGAQYSAEISQYFTDMLSFLN